MAITYKETVTYQDLIDDVIDKIKNLCINVDKAPSLPNEIKPGYEWRLSQFTRKSTNDCWAKAVIEGNTLLSDTLNKQVASSTVTSQFNSFLSSVILFVVFFFLVVFFFSSAIRLFFLLEI